MIPVTLYITGHKVELQLKRHQLDELLSTWHDAINETLNPRTPIDLQDGKTKRFIRFEISMLIAVEYTPPE